MKATLGFVTVLSVFLLNCGGGASAPAALGTSGKSSQSTQVSISLLPSTQPTIDAEQHIDFTASVTNDSSNQGVSWSVSGIGCSGSGCGTLTNTSKTAATYNAPATLSSTLTVALRATSVANNAVSASATVTANPSPAITTTSLPNGKVGSVYKTTLQASGGTAPVSWSVVQGTTLPAGLSLDSSTGVISGTPSRAGTTSFTVEATDSAPTPESARQQLNITVTYPLIVTTTSLSSGSVDVPYRDTLQESYGTLPVSWSISAGSLPPGLSIDASTGVISGTPTTAGVSQFTVMATDSTTPTPQTAEKALSISIQPGLVISTTSLPDGPVSVAYSATLEEDYGTLPVKWSLVSNSGSLPDGLSLDASTGVVSGTPTAAGTSKFTVSVTDSSSPPQVATQSLSITITRPNLAISTTSLPDGTLNVAYSATLQEAYGTLPVSWSISSGSLPSGLLLDSSSGVVSGVPTVAGTLSFTVTVTDSGSPPQTATQSLSITINASGQHDNELSGQYAFLLSGYDSNGYPVAAAGRFVADGAGSITGGVEDLNDAGSGLQPGLTITGGSYAVNSDNRGTVTFTNSAGGTYTLAIAVGNLSSGTIGTAEKGSAIEFDTSGYNMSGVIALQRSTDFYSGAMAGNYAFSFSGSDMAGSRTGAVGEFTANGSGGITGGQFDADDNGIPTAAAPIANTGAYSVDTSTGRGSATLNGLSPAPVHYIFYVVSANRLLAISTDASSTAGLVSGEMDLQSGAPFGVGSLNATEVMGVDSAAELGGSQVTTGLATFDGRGGVTSFSFDSNDAGSLTSATGSGTYTAPDSATGRFSLTFSQGMGPLVGYLIKPNRAFVLGTGSGVSAGTLQERLGGPFSASSLNTTSSIPFFFGERAFAAPPAGSATAALSTGVFNFDGSGNFAVTSDSNEQRTLLPDQTATATYTVVSSGKVTVGSGSWIFYIVSPTSMVTMSTSPADPNPTLGFSQQ